MLKKSSFQGFFTSHQNWRNWAEIIIQLKIVSRHPQLAPSYILSSSTKLLDVSCEIPLNKGIFLANFFLRYQAQFYLAKLTFPMSIFELKWLKWRKMPQRIQRNMNKIEVVPLTLLHFMGREYGLFTWKRRKMYENGPK